MSSRNTISVMSGADSNYNLIYLRIIIWSHSVLFYRLRGLRHEDFAVMGQFCAKIIT